MVAGRDGGGHAVGRDADRLDRQQPRDQQHGRRHQHAARLRAAAGRATGRAAAGPSCAATGRRVPRRPSRCRPSEQAHTRPAAHAAHMPTPTSIMAVVDHRRRASGSSAGTVARVTSSATHDDGAEHVGILGPVVVHGVDAAEGQVHRAARHVEQHQAEGGHQDGAHERGAGGGAADPAGDGDLHGGRDEEEDRDVPAVLQVHERRDHVTGGGGVQPDGREQRRRREAAQPGGGLLGGPPGPRRPSGSVDPSGSRGAPGPRGHCRGARRARAHVGAHRSPSLRSVGASRRR